MTQGPDDPKLSERERTVLLLAADGLTDKEIAGQLGLSLKTIHTYWDRMRQKFGASTRTQVFARFLRISIREDDKYGFNRIFRLWEDGVMLVHRDGRMIYNNPSAGRLLAINFAEFKLRTAFEMFAKCGMPQLKELVISEAPPLRSILLPAGEDRQALQVTRTPFADTDEGAREVVLLIRPA